MTMRMGGAVRLAIRFVLSLEQHGMTHLDPLLTAPVWPSFRFDFFSEASASQIKYGRWDKDDERTLAREVKLHYHGKLVAVLLMTGFETRQQHDGKTMICAYWGVQRIQYGTKWDIETKRPVCWRDVTIASPAMTSAEINGRPWGA